MNNLEQNLHIDDRAFESMRCDTDRVLQKLLKNMVEKGSFDGSINIKIDIKFMQEYIVNNDINSSEETRKILIPAFTHKVSSVMQIKEEAKGGVNYEGMEMVFDEELGEYVIKPVANTTQRSVFDSDFVYTNTSHSSQSNNMIETSRNIGIPKPDDY